MFINLRGIEYRVEMEDEGFWFPTNSSLTFSHHLYLGVAEISLRQRPLKVRLRITIRLLDTTPTFVGAF